jgi:hypothetical protein
MAGRIEFHNPGGKRSPFESSTIRSENLSLRELEARLQDLGDRLPSLGTDAEIVCLKGPHIFDPALDLRVKLDATRWMLRVAKHTERPARDQILAVITNCLDQLEKALDPKLHAV